MQADKGKTLLSIARVAIAETLGLPHTPIDELARDKPWLQEKAACFITLTQNEHLRGCIGTLEAHCTLLQDVIHNANAAAFHDNRFSPLGSDELDKTEIEVSLLSAMQTLHFSNEEDALAQLHPGIDGVLFESTQHRSTFLPQVWEQLPDKNDFMAHLKTKAGLPADFWSDTVKLSRYTVSKWKESDFTEPQESRSQ